MKRSPDRAEISKYPRCPSGYTFSCYCWICGDHEDYFEDGLGCYFAVRKYARRDGWILHSDGYATCKNCKRKIIT